MLALDITVFAIIGTICWQGYYKRRLWFEAPVYLLLRLGKGRGFWTQWFMYGPPVVGGLLLCHWLNTHGWHATAAGGMLFGMTIGLEAMRIAEEEQKWKREKCDVELEQ
ncbi:MAG: hypothetical protein Q9M12_06375 [Mariprofundus sp.]|nr:hypothetical protein [Mariprofundus sp.]